MNCIKILLGVLPVLLLNSSLIAFDNTHSTLQTPTQSFHLQKVLFTDSLRQEFSKFLDNILQQVPSQQFFGFIDATISNIYSDKDFYAYLITNVKRITPSFGFYYKLRALKYQKEILGRQIEKLIGSSKIDTIVEIGTPATYSASIKNHIKIGKVYAINDKKRLSDIAQSLSFNPFKKFVAYDQFIEINNYAPISKEAIPSNSIDVVVCTVGLHHVPQKKLDDFINSIRRILKSNGIFILRDHNVTNADLESLVYSAHSIFNIIVNQSSLAIELAECRNFKSLDDWINLLENHGFKAGLKRFIQPGDPTRNTMIKFTKMAQTQEEKEQELFTYLYNRPGYLRDNIQTYLTSPEWLNVDTSQEYAKFIEHTPFYEYPYFQNIVVYWKVFFHSWKQAVREKGKLAILTSPYTFMNLFIGIMMSIEYGTKGLISVPIKWINSGKEPKTIKLLIKDPKQELNLLENCIKIIERYPSVDMQLIEVPRYKEFLDIIIKLADTQITIVEIAGNKDIQLKICYKTSKKNFLNFELNGCEKLYTWHLKTKPSYTYAALKADVKQLREIIKYCQTNDVEILYIHDF